MSIIRYGSAIPSAERRFLDKTHADLGCWIWSGATMKGGYGLFYADGEKILAHRWSYAHYIGEIPSGMHIDHLCETRNCVNPMRLEPVTPRENLMRGRNHVALTAGKSHCYRGHEYDAVNTRIRPDGQRSCKACRRILDAKYRSDRKKASA